jgi:hypothetical protein
MMFAAALMLSISIPHAYELHTSYAIQGGRSSRVIANLTLEQCQWQRDTWMLSMGKMVRINGGKRTAKCVEQTGRR